MVRDIIPSPLIPIVIIDCGFAVLIFTLNLFSIYSYLPLRNCTSSRVEKRSPPGRRQSGNVHLPGCSSQWWENRLCIQKGDFSSSSCFNTTLLWSHRVSSKGSCWHQQHQHWESSCQSGLVGRFCSASWDRADPQWVAHFSSLFLFFTWFLIKQVLTLTVLPNCSRCSKNNYLWVS